MATVETGQTINFDQGVAFLIYILRPVTYEVPLHPGDHDRQSREARKKESGSTYVSIICAVSQLDRYDALSV